MPLRLDLTNKIRASRKELFGGGGLSHSILHPETLRQRVEDEVDDTPHKAIAQGESCDKLQQPSYVSPIYPEAVIRS